MNRSREKDTLKDNMQEYIQQERRMLTKIQELEDDKKRDEARLAQLEQARGEW